MIIEYSNAKEPKSHARLSVVIVVASCAFFFIPTTLIILGYLASQPTGTLISPLPQGVLSQSISPVGAIHESPAISPSPSSTQQLSQTPPLIAAPEDTTLPQNATSSIATNMSDKTASISAGLTETTVYDPEIHTTSQIYLTPRSEDGSIYSVKSKGEGIVVLEANRASDTVRYVDYYLVNP